jgi:hypothetical protein
MKREIPPATFYERFPQGIMTPTADPSCGDCKRWGYCQFHLYQQLADMVSALYHDYSRRLSWEEWQRCNSLKPTRLKSVSQISGVRRFLSS